MSIARLKGPGIKAAATVGLVGAALLAREVQLHDGHQDAFFSGMVVAALLFGILNVFLDVAGTTLVRSLAVGSVIAALLLPWRWWSAPIIVILVFWYFILWPTLILMAWGAGSVKAMPDDHIPLNEPLRPRALTAGLIAATAAGALAYQLLVRHHLAQTSALFIGIPALLAIFVVVGTSPRSMTGVACKAVTIGMLISMMFLWEGALCIVMSAPLFYGVAVLVGGAMDVARRERINQSTTSCLLLLVLLPMSLEGVTPSTSLNRDEWVTESRVVLASPSDVARAIVAAPRFDRPLPLYLRAGFPRATEVHVEESATGARWLITVRGGEMKLNGMEARTGTLVLEVEESRPGLIHWRVVSDDSHMTHFLRWREARVEWAATGDGATQVTWSLRYDRGLDPAWYFGPWERYAARLAAGYLINAVATP